MSLDINYMRQWVGSVQKSSDVVTPVPLACLNATLDRGDQEPQIGEELPPSGHWLYFLNPARQSEIDINGHAKKGEFLPPVPLERRMWAGGRLKFLAPLRIGDAIKRTSEIKDIQLKEGKSGSLVFVVVNHLVFGPDGLSIDEEHDIVYRCEPNQNGPSRVLEKARVPKWQRTIQADPILLFRYSALIFNSHRIHFDREYVTKKEGYPGLIVHGPLIATLLMDLCRRNNPNKALRRFDYRALSPIFDIGPFTINGCPEARGAELWALDQKGNVAMRGTAEFETP
ncbi:MAG: MaoC family dehydratase N-terminal domain-containing protein [Pseudomonadota bacterium]|nr:MaoC family dehydratase N-terminal domain-containing protein [Pseudomonadota bacterium]